MRKRPNERSECDWSKLPKKKLFLILKLILFITIFSFQWLRHTNYLKLIYNNRFNKKTALSYIKMSQKKRPQRDTNATPM